MCYKFFSARRGDAASGLRSAWLQMDFPGGGASGRFAFLAVALLLCALPPGCGKAPACPSPEPRAASSDTAAHARRVAQERIAADLHAEDAEIPRRAGLPAGGSQRGHQGACRPHERRGDTHVHRDGFALRRRRRPADDRGQAGAPAPAAAPERAAWPSPAPPTSDANGRPIGEFVLSPVPSERSGMPPGQDEAYAMPGTPVPGQAVTMRQAGNIRGAPSGEAQLVRVAPKGAYLRVFSQAPGGWLQVGDTNEPEGWVHSSLVEPF